MGHHLDTFVTFVTFAVVTFAFVTFTFASVTAIPHIFYLAPKNENCLCGSDCHARNRPGHRCGKGPKHKENHWLAKLTREIVKAIYDKLPP